MARDVLGELCEGSEEARTQAGQDRTGQGRWERKEPPGYRRTGGSGQAEVSGRM